MILIDDKNKEIVKTIISALKYYKYDLDKSAIMIDANLKEEAAYTEKQKTFFIETKNKCLNRIEIIDKILKELEK